MRIKNKITLTVLLIVTVLSLSGCDSEETIKKIFNPVGDEFLARMEDNAKINENLYNEGYISKKSYDAVKNNIDNAKTKWADIGMQLTKVSASGSSASDIADSIQEQIKTAMTKDSFNIWEAVDALSFKHANGMYIFGELQESKSEAAVYLGNFMGRAFTGWNTESEKDKIYSNGIYNNTWVVASKYIKNNKVVYDGENVESIAGLKVKAKDGNVYSIKTNNGKVKPLEIVSNDVVKDMKETLEFPIYVLNPNIGNMMGKSKSLDAVYFYIQELLNKDNIADEILCGEGSNKEQYFVKALDSAGKEVTLESMIAGMSYEDMVGETRFSEKISDKAPGNDLIITQKIDGKDEPVMSIKLNEFNQEAIDKLNSATGIFNYDASGKKGRFLVSRDGEHNRIYLLEYPVYVIDKLFQTGAENAEVSLSESGIGVNILTGKTIKYAYDSNNEKYLPSGTYINDSNDEKSNMYLTSCLYGNNNGDIENSSFSVFGYCNIELVPSKAESGIQVNSKSVTAARVVLRDYLELTYAPGYTEESNLVVFGRKIRMNILDSNVVADTISPTTYYYNKDNKKVVVNQMKLKYSTSEISAYYVDKNGKQLETKRSLYITDFCDAKSLTDNSKKGDYSNNKVINLAVVGTEAGVRGQADIFNSGVPNIDEIKHITINNTSKNSEVEKIAYGGVEYDSISPSLMFPGLYIGKEDQGSSNKVQRFYGLAVKTGLFNSGLFAYWINSTNADGSLIWWNGYLKQCGFKYNVTNSAVNSYLTSYYASDLADSGIAIIDLNTIQKISDIYEREVDNDRLVWARTMFAVIGWTMIVVSTVMMLLWVLDTNVDFGQNLVEKATLGHWIAVKGKEDMPETDDDERSYVTGGKMMLKCLILIFVGVILIRINVFYIVNMFINIFGGLASAIEKLIRGI